MDALKNIQEDTYRKRLAGSSIDSNFDDLTASFAKRKENRFKSVNDGDESSKFECDSPEGTMKKYRFLNDDIEIREEIIESGNNSGTKKKENVLRESIKLNQKYNIDKIYLKMKNAK